MPDGEEKGPDIIPANIINRAYYSGENITKILDNFQMRNIFSVFSKKKYTLTRVNFVPCKRFSLFHYGMIIYVIQNATKSKV